eukprot:scaffold156705_cov15-Prasinocladus_malaysianus.AAC.1
MTACEQQCPASTIGLIAQMLVSLRNLTGKIFRGNKHSWHYSIPTSPEGLILPIRHLESSNLLPLPSLISLRNCQNCQGKLSFTAMLNSDLYHADVPEKRVLPVN